MKIKILELATGNENVEGWTFLEDFEIGRGLCRLDSEAIIFSEHFAMFGFREGRYEENTEYLRQYPTGPRSMALWPHSVWYKMDDILILNLASRKKFWMKTKTIVRQAKEKATDEENRGIPYNQYDVNSWRFEIDQMTTRVNEIEIQCGFETWLPTGRCAIIG